MEWVIFIILNLQIIIILGKKEKYKILLQINFQNMIKRNKQQKMHLKKFNQDNKELVK